MRELNCVTQLMPLQSRGGRLRGESNQAAEEECMLGSEVFYAAVVGLLTQTERERVQASDKFVWNLIFQCCNSACYGKHGRVPG